MSNYVDVSVMQDALDQLVEWADLWQLQLSITKCNSMHVSRQPEFSVKLKIRDLSLPIVNPCRIFGSTCLKMNDYFTFSPVRVTRGHPYKPFVPRAVVNTRKHYFCVHVIDPSHNLHCATVDFSTLRQFKCSLRPSDLSQYLEYRKISGIMCSCL